jgi:predicted TIM-barrel fold metal-dependent hydrolase
MRKPFTGYSDLWGLFMPQAQRLISTVDHVVEHPEVWTKRLSKSRWGDRIPHVEYSSQEGDAWFVDGRRLPLSECAQVGAVMNDRADAPKRWGDVPPSAYLPAERLRAMDTDGVAYSVLYPSFAGFSGETFGALTDSDLELDCVQAYNDWLIEEWVTCSDRFIPQCIVPLGPAEATVGEIKRAVGRGHKGVVFPAAPMNLRKAPHINAPAYDPIWATCRDLRVPLCFHAGSARQLQFPVAPTLSPELAAAMQAVTRPASAVFDLVNLLFSRILLRFPSLKVIFAESTIGWGTFILEYADHQYEQDHCDYELKPSEMFKRQCYLTAWYDPVRINARHIGADRILWATNFPTANSSWPDSQGLVEKCFEGMTEEERNQILRRNAAELYKL